MGWRSCPLDPWLLRSKLGLASSNGHRSDGTYNNEVSKLGIRDIRVANDPRVGKSGFVSHTKNTMEAMSMDLFHSQLITCTM